MSKIINLTEQNLEGFLHQQFVGRCQSEQLHLSDEASLYIIKLACRFIDSEQLFLQDQTGRSLPVLAMIYKDALEAKNAKEQHNLLRTLADTAFFLAACFPNVWQRRGLDRSYFVHMGQGAFNSLASLNNAGLFPFAELARNFGASATHLGEVVFPQRRSNIR